MLTALGSRTISVQSGTPLIGAPQQIRFWNYCSLADPTFTRTDVIQYSPQTFILHDSVYSINNLIHAAFQDICHGPLMIRDSGMPTHEEIIGTLLKAQFRFWKVLNLVNHVARNYNPFVGMVKDPIRLAGILSSSLVSWIGF